MNKKDKKEEYVHLKPIITKIIGDFEFKNDIPEMDIEKQAEWFQELMEFKEEEAKEIATELLAVAINLKEEAGEEAAFEAIKIISIFVGALLGTKNQANELFEQHYMQQAPKITGNEALKNPVGSEDKPKGSFNPLDFRLGKK